MPVAVEVDDFPTRRSGPRRVYGSTNVPCAPLAYMPVPGAGGRERLVGRVLDGRFEVTAEIGPRPFGTAFRALDLSAGPDGSPSRRAVTVTRLEGGIPWGGDVLDRVRSSAELIRRLNHRSLDAPLRIFEAEGAAFTVSRTRTGRRLGDLLARTDGSGWPLRSVLPLGHRIAEALEHAHSVGLVHGALTPASVLLTPADEVIVMDLGLRSAVGSGGIDYREDVLGLARLVLALLTGSQDAGDVPLSGRPAGLRDAAWAGLLQGLASDPALRPTTPEALVVALEDPGWFRRLVGRRTR